MLRLTVGRRIVLGFGTVLLLLAFVAWEGRQALQDSSQGFDRYRGMALHSSLAAQLQTSMMSAHRAAMTAIHSGRTKHLEAARESQAALAATLEQAAAAFSGEQETARLQQMRTDLQEFGAGFERGMKLRAKQDELLKQLRERHGISMQTALISLMDSAQAAEDAAATAYAGYALRNLLTSRMYMQQYLVTGSEDDFTLCMEELLALLGSLATLDFSLTDERQLGLLNQVREQREAYYEKTNQVKEIIDERKAIAAQTLDTVAPKVNALVAELNAATQERQATLGPRLQRSNQQTTQHMNLTAAAAVVLGLLLAFLIGRSIARPLKQATAFAKAVAQGDFSRQLTIHRTDEIGQLCNALRTIPQVLDNVGRQFGDLVHGVERGELDRQASTNEFQGAFAELMDGGNTLVRTYVDMLDRLPTPIATMDTDLNIRHMNAAARGMVSAQLEQVRGQSCADFFCMNDCGSESCVGTLAMLEGEPKSSETMAQTNSGDLEVHYSTVPLRDRDGTVVGVMKVVTDLTDVKRAQHRMAHTARQASDIAARLSSASEQLSLHVEEVNEGAAIQLQRVQATTLSMEQMDATSNEVASHAGSTAQGLEASRNQANQGAEVVRQAVGVINSVSAQAEELRQTMHLLGEQAQGIDEIMHVINDIADQTNLLALNAAIEAARAGDAGKGFAVVADEVRKLAEKTMGATSHVGASIKAIQDSARVNMATTEAATSTVAQAVQLISDSGQAFASIVEQAESNAARVQEIAAAAEQQSSASSEVMNAVNDVSAIVTSTAQGMRTSAQAVGQLAQLSTELTNLMNVDQ